MKVIDKDKIEEILQGNAESLSLEFKATFNFSVDQWPRERFIRTILAMSNTRDGGYIVIGVKENKDKSYTHEGVHPDHLATFQTKIEDIKSTVESFSSSPVNYEVGIGEYKNKKFILISVSEFILNPLICRKNGEHADRILEEGAIYVRTLKDKASSVKLINPVDIQDFLERSTDKQISSLHKRGWVHISESAANVESSFKKERGNF